MLACISRGLDSSSPRRAGRWEPTNATPSENTAAIQALSLITATVNKPTAPAGSRSLLLRQPIYYTSRSSSHVSRSCLCDSHGASLSACAFRRHIFYRQVLRGGGAGGGGGCSGGGPVSIRCVTRSHLPLPHRSAYISATRVQQLQASSSFFCGSHGRRFYVCTVCGYEMSSQVCFPFSTSATIFQVNHLPNLQQ